MGAPFHCDFTGRYGARTDAQRFTDLNDAARLFLLIAQDCWPGYDCDLCSRVHDTFYRRLDRSRATAPITPK